MHVHRNIHFLSVNVRLNMAATLPPINGSGGGSRKGQHVQQHFIPAPRGPPSGKLKPLKKIQSKTDRDLYIKQEILRQQQPELSKRQTTSYRNSYKHNLCLDMLQEGYHRSFDELFALIKQQEEERQQQGPESLMWSMTLLKDQHEKLDMLKRHLTLAEKAYRAGDFADVYRNRFTLACYFQTTDKWLADHFFQTCLQTAGEMSDGDGKMKAEGHCNVGLAMEENGDIHGAAEQFENYYKLSTDHKEWIQSDGLTYNTDACIHLCRIYTTLARSESTEPETTLEYLNKALEMAKESLDRKLEGEASYRLGLAYDQGNDGETALLHLNNYLEICNASSDSDGIGKACDAIAKAYARQGKVNESITYLKKFVEVTESSGEEKAYSKACHNLGNIYNTLGRYEEATEYFSKAYNLSRTMGDAESISTNRVQFGIAMAHKMLAGISEHVVTGHRQAIERIIEWKNARTDEFDKPYPEPKEEIVKPRTPTPLPPASEKGDEENQEQENEKENENKNTEKEEAAS